MWKRNGGGFPEGHQGEGAKGRPNYKATYQCTNDACKEKGQKKGFLDDGLMFIPLPDGR